MNAAKANPEIVLMLDRPRKACFNLKAMCVLEEHYEKLTGERQLHKAINWKALNVRDISAILWASLVTDDETLTFDDACKILTVLGMLENVDKVMLIVEDLMERAMAQIDDADVDRITAALEKKTEKLATLKNRAALISSKLSPSESSNSDLAPSKP